MKNAIITIVALITLASCTQENIRVSNELITAEYNYTDIDAIDISGEFEVIVDLSNSNQGVTTEFNKELESFINVVNNNGTLKVYYNKDVSVRGRVKNKIYLTTALIDKVKITGEVSVSISGKNTVDQFIVDMAGESALVSTIDVDNLTVNLTGESKVELSGSAANANIETTGESELTDYGLIINNLTISMTGESRVKLRVENTINISTTGESEFRYMGPASFTSRSETGDSKIIKAG